MSASAGRVLLIPKGTYDSSITYMPMDIVKYGVSSYVCKLESTGNVPTNTTYWQILAEGISNVSPEGLGIGYGVSSDSGASRTATLADYILTPNGIVSVSFASDVPANATLNINSQGAKAIYFRGSALTANVIKGGDTVTFQYDGTRYQILCIDGGAGHKILNSAGTELTQRDDLQFTDGLEAVDDTTKTKVKMNLPTISLADWNAMTEQEKTAYKSAHYRFGIELPDSQGVINANIFKLVWENPSTSSEFVAQNITFSGVYDYYLVLAYQSTSTLRTVSAIFKATDACMLNYGTSGNNGVITGSRYISATSTPNVFSVTAGYTATGTSAFQTNNAICIPYRIFGFNETIQFKVNAIASELSTRADHCFLDDEVTTVEDAFEWKQVYTDTTSGTITVSQDFREVMVDVGNTSGTNAVRFSFMFPKGFVTRKRAGYYATNTNFGQADVIYDGNSTFTVTYFSGGLQITSYTNVYYR